MGTGYQSYTCGLQVVECCECGTPFGIIDHLINKLRENGNNFYCPNGHQQHFGESAVQRLQKELTATQAQLRAEKCEVLRVNNDLERERKAAQRLTRRVKNGVCPCCKRTVKQLAAHMKAKHPEWKEEVK